MLTKKLLSATIGAALFGSMGAAMADDYNVYKPKDGDAAIGSSPAVNFFYDSNATGYLVDLVGPNTSDALCDGAVAFNGYVTRAGSDCLDTAGTAASGATITNGDDGTAATDTFPPGVATRVCTWNAPTLAAGKYALSVTSYNAKATGLLGVAGGAVDAGAGDYLFRTADCGANYQDFTVTQATEAPEPVAAKTPVAGVSCATNTPYPTVVAAGCQPTVQGTNATHSVDPTATWFQIWINDKDGFNLTQAWYQVGTVIATNAVCTVIDGVKTCSVPDQATALAGGSAPYTWWVRSWNPAGASAWSTAATMTD